MSKKICINCKRKRKLKNGWCSKCRDGNKVIVIDCPQCGGDGVDGVIAEHGCGGDEERCAHMCPVPAPEQCCYCGGGGQVEAKKVRYET
ncbi:MAG: hypothetical protein KAT71_08180 [Gammaproteobacteria bacterium]|nr:hypothetical protein [Gammaproteobacteria bacterium]